MARHATAKSIEPDIATDAEKKQRIVVKEFPNAIATDWRLGFSEFFLLAWRAQHKDDWTSRQQQLAEEHGFGQTHFYDAMRKLKAAGYIQRTQSKGGANAWFEYAEESLNLKAFASSKSGHQECREGYQLLRDDFAGIPWRQVAMLVYLRAFPETYIQSAARIGKRFGISAATVRRIMKPLEQAGLVALSQKRNPQGHFAIWGYAALREPRPGNPDLAEPEVDNHPVEHSPETDFAICGETTKHNPYSPHNPLTRTHLKPETSSGFRKSYTLPTPKASEAPSLSQENRKRKSGNSSAKAKKTKKEQRDFARLCQRARNSIDSERRPTDEGVQISDREDLDGQHLVSIYFKDLSDEAIQATYCLNDAQLRQAIEHVAGRYLKKNLLGREGLKSVRSMIAGIMNLQTSEEPPTAAEAFEAILNEISRSVTKKGRWLNSWNLIARRLAGELYTKGGFDMLLLDDDGESLPEKFRRQDRNGILSPELFTPKGVGALRKLIKEYGGEHVSEAVSKRLMESLTSSHVEAGHVRAWGYFRPSIREQIELESASRR